MKKGLLFVFCVSLLSFPSCSTHLNVDGLSKKSIVGYFKNGYVLDSDNKVRGTYRNGYLLDNDSSIIGTYRNGYILNMNDSVVATYSNGFILNVSPKRN